MFRINGPGATPDGRFQAGDSATGQKATAVTQKWANDVQEEVAGVVEGFGAALAADNDKQMYQVLVQALLSAREQSWPVGSLYVNRSDSRNPATILGFGTWVAAQKGRVIVGVGSNGESMYSAAQTGGQENVSLTGAQNGPHYHSFTRVNLDTSSINYASSTEKYVTFLKSSTTTSADTTSSGDGAPHENRMPFETAYAWWRTA